MEVLPTEIRNDQQISIKEWLNTILIGNTVPRPKPNKLLSAFFMIKFTANLCSRL